MTLEVPVHDIAIIGAGGFAREVRELIVDINAEFPRYRFRGYVVSDLSSKGAHDSAIRGDYGWLADNGIRCVAIGIGSPAARVRVLADMRERGLSLPALIHPTASIGADSMLEQGAIACAGVRITVGCRLRAGCMANLNVTIGHEAIIGEGAVINPGANISGGVLLSKGVLVGTGAQILQYLTVGEGAQVGAGCVIVRDVPPGDTMLAPLPKRIFTKQGASNGEEDNEEAS